MPDKEESELELSRLRKEPLDKTFWPYWRGPYEKRKKSYAGSELYKQHMKGVIDGTIR